ncbi:NADH-quinone oxidoreductase subunit NuoE [Gaoshiqia sediminis]|uniref:NADH-quinone oxidoreductase subunit NuoE n=1 Tax=Gaoshiqia sediminis TaxID=2986998 RepID=A0AA41Y783_9BACT|nr:NADH-quinone oxidoreductase subunit NuoE [Gaoshiqia sediminis]MCW0482756.1 NADH-quinone oxidoreductase subunit NuoE [Gaoshiqia sediminis]
MPKIKLAEKTVELIREICAQFNNQETELINVLHQVQHKLGYLPAEVQEVIAKELNASVAKVYGVVTFYSFFTMLPQGQHPISICMGTACYVRGAEKVLTEFKRQLGIEVGQTSADGKFSLSCLRCVGACGLAPVVLVGEKVYGRVSPQQVSKIIAEYQDGCASAQSA